MGVAVYCERSYALARFYIHEGLKIARKTTRSAAIPTSTITSL